MKVKIKTMLFYRNRKKKKLVIAIFLFLLLLLLLIENLVLRNTIKYQHLIKIFDLNKPLEPNRLYDGINCKLSPKISGIETTLCINDENYDFDSKSMSKYGVSNRVIMSKFNFILDELLDNSLISKTKLSLSTILKNVVKAVWCSILVLISVNILYLQPNWANKLFHLNRMMKTYFEYTKLQQKRI